MKKGFGSDNHSGTHPELLKAIVTCNGGHEPSYGTDQYSLLAAKDFKNHFGPQTESYFVFNGTAANVLALRFLCDRHESVFCSSISHVNLDEGGAPELLAGKLIPLPHSEGKISLQTLQEHFVRRGDQHYSQSRVVTLTQPTELGTCYSRDEIKSICDWAHSNGLFVHIDGARLTNALVHLDCTFKEMTTDCGVDVVSFGGTKNGLMMGEAVLVLNPSLSSSAKQKMKYLRKQITQLPSKTRFISAQFHRYFSDGLYLQIAKHSCRMAQLLQEGLAQNTAVQITAAVQSNAVFAVLPKEIVKPLKEKFFFYVWDEKTFECRIMTSWDTTEAEVQEFIHELQLLTAKK
ncbi:threonine aldolase family protein [Pseudobdellovibrio exovorus]|uniref:Low specificity L-threonine aldolase protein n=1 Tax=Pseudobdellovibrio exovorus JSS TaxID=1184267 RepID=M4VA02_9BACT|nr:beta-eliminating lyase-related protein [Pseudobdellovibrio exovorus]AGH95290.1 low specificity L-threonine aldolase protein [Pseudobdellovibrio exovorus JSS]